jgi:hypothetical protein
MKWRLVDTELNAGAELDAAEEGMPAGGWLRSLGERL